MRVRRATQPDFFSTRGTDIVGLGARAVWLAVGLAACALGVGYGAAPPDSGVAFFARLDLSRSDLTRVRVLVSRKNYPAAKEALRDHFLDRRVRAGFWPSDSRSAQNPDALVRHVFSFYGSKPFDAGTPIRWNAVFLNDRELTYALNRHQHLATLGAAYRRTKDAKYARAFVEQVRDWIAQNGASEKNNWAAWRNLEVAVRIGVWSDVFFQFLRAPEFTPDDQVLMLESLHAQARWLAPQVESRRGQWGPSLATGLAAAALLFPEFQQSGSWRAQAYASLLQNLQDEVYPDGSDRSFSPHQHNARLTTFWLPLKLAVEHGYTVPQTYRDLLERMAVFQAYVRRPDGRYPAFNASDSQDCRLLLTAAARFFGRPDFDYILTRGRSGTAPTSRSLAFRESGIHIMRDSWKADANYLAIDAGPYGATYQHEDKFSFELAAYGQTLLVDPGRYSLDPSEALTGYLSTTAAHNTLTVDGTGQLRRSFSSSWAPPGNAANCWISRPAFDYFAGVYTEGYQNAPGVRHLRRIFFVKNPLRPYWVISDRVIGRGRHRLTSRLQFAPGTLERRGPLGVVTKSPKGNVAICPPQDAAGLWSAKVLTGSRNPFGGWVSLSYGKIQPAPQLLYDLETTLPATMEYALVPFRASANVPAVRRFSPGGGTAGSDETALEIDFGGVRDTLYIAHHLKPAGREIAGRRTKGCFVVVRKKGSEDAVVLIDSDAGGARPPTATSSALNTGVQARPPQR